MKCDAINIIYQDDRSSLHSIFLTVVCAQNSFGEDKKDTKMRSDCNNLHSHILYIYIYMATFKTKCL